MSAYNGIGNVLYYSPPGINDLLLNASPVTDIECVTIDPEGRMIPQGYEPLQYCNGTALNLPAGAVSVNLFAGNGNSINNALLDLALYRAHFAPEINIQSGLINVEVSGDGDATCSSTSGVFLPTKKKTFEFLGAVPSSGVVDIECTKPIATIATHTGGDLYHYYPVMQRIQVSANVDSGPPTLQISAVHFYQSIMDPKLPENSISNSYDAVIGKSSTFKAVLTGSNLKNAAAGDQIRLKIMSNGAVVSESSSIPISTVSTELAANGSFTVHASQFSDYIPTLNGSLQLQMQIDKNSAPDLNVTSHPISLIGHQMRIPKIGFLRINGFETCTTTTSGCISNPTDNDFDSLFGTSNYLSRLYPVPDNSISYLTADNITAGSSITWDAVRLEFIKHLFTDLDELVAVVSNSYFDYNDMDVAGVVFRTMPGIAFVTNYESNLQVVPHEIAHAYGVWWEEYSNVNGQIEYDGTSVDGFDETTGTPFKFDSNADEFSQIWSIMGPPRPESVVNGGPANEDRYWIDKRTYQTLLANIPKIEPDPKVILISGVLDKSGKFEFGPAAVQENGILSSQSPTGNIKVSTLDSSGNILQTVVVESDFSAYVLPKLNSTLAMPILDLNEMPIVSSLPYDDNASSIQITVNGNTVAKVSLSGQVVQGILEMIPDRAFKTPKSLEGSNLYQGFIINDRKILNNIAARIKIGINSDEPTRAIGPCSELIQEIRRLTFDNYIVTNQSEITQAQAIATISNVEDQLRKTVKKEK